MSDAWVKLRGNITERLSDDRYTFRDESGTWWWRSTTSAGTA